MLEQKKIYKLIVKHNQRSRSMSETAKRTDFTLYFKILKIIYKILLTRLLKTFFSRINKPDDHDM